MKLSARNVLEGKVKSIIPEMVNSEIVIELPGGTENHFHYHKNISWKSELKSRKWGLRSIQGLRCDDSHRLTAYFSSSIDDEKV